MGGTLRFSEQTGPELFSLLFARFLPALFTKPEIVAVVGPVLFFYGLCLRLHALIRLHLIVEDTIEANPQVGPAHGTFVTARDEFKSHGASALVASFHILSKSSFRREITYPFPDWALPLDGDWSYAT